MNFQQLFNKKDPNKKEKNTGNVEQTLLMLDKK